MRAAVVNDWGQPPQFQSFPEPVAAEGESAGRTIALPGAILRSIDLTMLGSGFGSASLDSIFAAIPALFQMAADGKLKVEVEPVPLSQVESAWNHGEKGRRVVFEV